MKNKIKLIRTIDLSGFWILKDRKEDNQDKICEFMIGDKKYKFIIPEIEILYFSNKKENMCYQIGIKKRSEEERKEYDYDKIFEGISWLPGSYNIKNKTIKILDEGKLEILPNGDLYIVEELKDYSCKETWTKISNKNTKLINFIKNEVEKL